MPPLVEQHCRLLTPMEPPRNGATVSSVHVGERTRHHHPHHLTPTLWTALYDYDAQGEDELSLRAGQIVEVLSEGMRNKI